MAHTLASELFENHEDPMPAFSYIGEHGRGLLLSALAQPQQAFGGRYLYRTVFEKSAALVYSIIKNHAFVDGNKRMGVATLLLFLGFNGCVLFASDDELVDLALAIANNKMTQTEVASWLRKRTFTEAKLGAVASGRSKPRIPLTRNVIRWGFQILRLFGSLSANVRER